MKKREVFFGLPPAKNVLVFAPHMDDEVLGCGGSLLQYKKLGSSINIIYLTNGNKKTIANNVHIERKKEALSVLVKLRPNSMAFWDYDDGSLKLTKELIEKIEMKLMEINPDMVFVPNIEEMHSDHMVTSKAVIAAIGENSGIKIAYYEIWTPLLYPNCFVNISSIMNEKKQLIECYQSQLKKYKLIDLMLSLNSYRASFFPLKTFKYVEAFLINGI